ncbi:pirin domain-containing protein [Athelia psychrophila]|uniref:Pirin domain-containing protein n=1 Tax=Athelia psychrophila TaxID=1759441 RepID=A0A166C2K3_9AGAM|nr:pirin domain-containing protein [Fibularhizoctonia sp. CBS 109695]
MASDMKLVLRPSTERGHADHGWLKSFHTFSFANYQDSKHSLFGSLHVINEDRVAPRTGFGTHPHMEAEIFSYIVSGELQHNDSMGNTEVLKRGDIQLTSAGTGISHSEKAHGSKQVHFLQIWSLPSVSRLAPTYFTRHFTDAEKKDQWVRVVAPIGASGVSSKREDAGPAPVQSPLTLYSTILSPSTSLPHRFSAGSTKGYIHVIQTSGYNAGAPKGATIRVSGGGGVEVQLKEGDGAYITLKSKKDLQVENVGGGVAEVLLFELD